MIAKLISQNEDSIKVRKPWHLLECNKAWD